MVSWYSSPGPLPLPSARVWALVGRMNWLLPPFLLLCILSGCGPTDDSEPKPGETAPAPLPADGLSATGGASSTGGVDNDVADALAEAVGKSASGADLDDMNVEQLLRKLLSAKNPDFNGQAEFQTQCGMPVAISLAGTGVTDISMLADLPLMRLDLSNNPISDLSALEGMPLRELFLENTRVTDLSPIEGSPLIQIFLNKTRVSSIKPLKGMPLKNIYLPDTRVKDLSPLRGMATLEGLWLNDTPVENIEPLRGLPLVTLTLRGTNVKDLSPLSVMPRLQRLHIAESRVTDLTPVTQLRLTRLLFTPGRINKGIDLVRRMPTLREIGDSLEGKLQPTVFWQQYDNGVYR